jgi:hypothetical protein
MIRIDPATLRTQIAALLAEHPELADDEELRLSAIEGETDTFELLALVLAEIRDAQTMRAALQQRVDALQARAHRFERREQFHRTWLSGSWTRPSFARRCCPRAR